MIAQRYQLLRVLGEGGMGQVWEARDDLASVSVALKLIHPTLREHPKLRQRFLREARAVVAAAHPNVVRVHDVLEVSDGTLAIAMELLAGETLRARLTRQEVLSARETAAIFVPVISAAGTAHSLGIVHRDLKPENIFLSRAQGLEPTVKVLDFGIAQLDAEEQRSALTTPGTMLATPRYAAPEQAFGDPDVDHRADIWSIGAMLYESLSGGRPIEGATRGQVLKRLMTVGIMPIGDIVPDLPNDVGSLVMQMLASDREERPPDLRLAQTVLARHTTVSAPAFAPPRRADERASPGKPDPR